MSVTVVGAGRMGSAMAARLAETAHRGTVWDRNPGHAAGLAEFGVTAAAERRRRKDV
jgi:3-hydroxyisobutyrate dehydrogenase-like beta-hydroxyacid dehydrogenase